MQKEINPIEKRRGRRRRRNNEKNDASISRREFIKLVGIYFPLIPVALGNINLLKENTTQVEEIEGLNRNTFYIVLGKHGYMNRVSEQIPLEPVINADYLVLEGLDFNELAKKIPPNFNGNIELNYPIDFDNIFKKMGSWYRQLPEILKKRKNPPFFVGVETPLSIPLPIGTLTTFAIPYLIQLLAAENLSKNLSRKEFLKSIPEFLLYIWGNTAFARNLLDFFINPSEEETKQILREIKTNLQLAHPENFILLFRNLTITEKLFYLEKQTKESKITLLIGEGHEDIVTLLKKDEDFCLNALHTLYPDSIKKFLIEKDIGYNRIFIYKPGTTKIEVISDPNLSLIKEKQFSISNEFKF